LTSMMP